MHEMSLVERLFEILEETAAENRIGRITEVAVSLGAARQVIPETFRFAFEIRKRGTLAASAELLMETVPVQLFCRSCGAVGESDPAVYLCPRCGSLDTEIIAGEEFLLKSFQGEREEEP